MRIRAIACGWAAVLMSSVTGTGVTRALGAWWGWVVVVVGVVGWEVVEYLIYCQTFKCDCSCEALERLLCIDTSRSHHVSNPD